MTMIQVESACIPSIRKQRAPVISTLRQFLAHLLPEDRARWDLLNERLLRDVGRTSLDAEISRLQDRWGVSDIGYSSHPRRS